MRQCLSHAARAARSPRISASTSALSRSRWVTNRPCDAPSYTVSWLPGIARAVRSAVDNERRHREGHHVRPEVSVGADAGHGQDGVRRGPLEQPNGSLHACGADRAVRPPGPEERRRHGGEERRAIPPQAGHEGVVHNLPLPPLRVALGFEQARGIRGHEHGPGYTSGAVPGQVASDHPRSRASSRRASGSVLDVEMTMLDKQSKGIPIDEQANDHVVHLDRLREADRLADQAFDPCA